MKGDLRCIDGRLWRHDPQPDDPNLETDVGVCDDCAGHGCVKCERCGAVGPFSVNVEAFELSGKVVCDDCAAEIFDEAANAS
jgi:hypothetical protein